MSFGKGTQLSGSKMNPRFSRKQPVTVQVKKPPSTQHQINNIDKRIKKINKDEELKWLDTYQAPTATSVTPTAVYISGVPQADPDREGWMINCTSIQMRIRIVQNIAATTNCSVRVLLLWDSQPNNLAFTPTTLPFTVVTITDTTLAPYNLQQQKRFKILLDRTLDLEAKAGVSGTPLPAYKTMRIRRKLSRQAKYNASGSGIASCVTNALYLVYLTDAAALQPTLQFGSRLIYKDQ